MSTDAGIYDLHGYTFHVAGSDTSDCVVLSCYGPMGALRLASILGRESALELATKLINASERQRATWTESDAA